VNAFKQLCDYVEKILNAVAICLLVLMSVAIFYQVVLRYIFQNANIWAEEFARYAFVWVVLLSSASAIRRFQHIRIDFLVAALPKRIRDVVNFFNNTLMFGFLLVLTCYGLDISGRTGNQITAGLGIPMSVMYLSIPVGCGFMLLFLLESILNEYLPAAAHCSRDENGA
jgi:C4-dicarboxylate transporter DctQ subunit